MDWNELKEEAKKMGYIYTDGDVIRTSFSDTDITFYNDGDIIVNHDTNLKRDASYDQMLAIMKALQ